MNEQLRRQIIREFPELQAGYHLPAIAEVLEIQDAPEAGGINDNFRPRAAATIAMLDSAFRKTGVEFEAVPVAILGAGTERGFFALPEKGAIVEIAWLNGSPELPFIRSQLGYRKALPKMQADEMRWQQSEDAAQSVDKAGNWKRKTKGVIDDQAGEIKQTAQTITQRAINKITRLLGSHREDIDGEKRTEATAINLLSATHINLMAAAGINIATPESATRSAGEIHDRAKGSARIEAKKIHIGSEEENALKIMGETLEALASAMEAIAQLTVTSAAPGVPTGTPINATAFAGIKSDAEAIKARLDAFTL